jgi:hypothetical protein
MHPRLARIKQQQRQQEPIKPLHPFGSMPHRYSLPQHDDSHRCKQTGICDGDHSAGPDGLGNVTSAKQRQEHVRKAISWSWEGYRWVLYVCRLISARITHLVGMPFQWFCSIAEVEQVCNVLASIYKYVMQVLAGQLLP